MGKVKLLFRILDFIQKIKDRFRDWHNSIVRGHDFL